MRSPSLNAEQLAAWCGGRWEPVAPGLVRGASIDSRTAQEFNLFFAVHRPEFDAHEFIDAAFEAGIAGAVVHTDFAGVGTAEKPLLRVSDPNQALSAIAAAYRRSREARILGITGSMGKTTVKEMTAGLLSRIGSTCRTIGNFNNDFGLPLSLLQLEVQDDYGVFELGMNHPGEIRPLAEMLRPDWGIMTRIGPVHIGNFESMEGIADEKAELFSVLPSQGLAFACLDDPWYARVAGAASCRVVSVSLHKHADYRGRLNSVAREMLIHEERTGEKCLVQLPLPGKHIAENALLAAAVGRMAGCSWESIGGELASYQPLKGRWQKMRIGEVTIIHDAYNANPGSVKAALEAFAEMDVEGGRWLVLGGMLELGRFEKALHHEVGNYASSGTWRGLVAFGELGAQIAQGAIDGGMNRDQVINLMSHEEAARFLRDHTRPGDAVLFKASRGEALEKIVEYWSADLSA